MLLSDILKMNPLLVEMGVGSNPKTLKKDGWIHNDKQYLFGIDLVAPCDNLRLPTNSVSKLYSSHLLEHIHWDLTEQLLKYWLSLLKSKGSLEIVCPNIEYAMQEFIKCSENGTNPPAMVYRILWGTRNAGTKALPPNNVHHNGFTIKTLKKLLDSVGFIQVKTKFIDRFGIPNRDLYCIGYKK